MSKRLVYGQKRSSWNTDTSDPVNLGNPREMTILQFAETIRDLTESQSEIAFEPLPVDDPKIRQPDITRATEVLGWRPEVALEDGLRNTVGYFRELLAIPSS